MTFDTQPLASSTGIRVESAPIAEAIETGLTEILGGVASWRLVCRSPWSEASSD